MAYIQYNDTSEGLTLHTVRTQIYLPETLHRRLKDRGRKLHRSLADQVREAVERYLDETPEGLADDDTIWSIMRIGDSGETDGSRRHDDILYDAGKC